MSNRVVEYIIKATDKSKSVLQSVMSGIKSFASHIGNGLSAVGRNLTNIQSGFQMLAGVVQKAWAAMNKAVAFEKMTYQFKTLIGNIDDARAHMQMLQSLGDTPPFSLEEFAKASRTLMVMSEGALGFKDSLNLIGDAAAATGQPVETLADAVGRAYAIIRDGQPITRATMQLRNMGVITPAVAAKLDDMQKAGASNIEVWNELTGALGKYKGAMEDTEKTTDGMMGALSAQWDDAVREFTGAFNELAKDGLGSALQGMKDLNESGQIDLWADKCVGALETVIDKFKEAKDSIGLLIDGIEWLYERSGLSDVWHGVNSIVQGGAQAIGTAVGGGSWDDIGRAYDEGALEEMAKGYYMKKGMESGFIQSAYDPDLAKRYAEAEDDAVREAAEHQQKVLDEARERKAQKDKEAADKAAENERKAKEKMEADMARAQEKADQEAYDAWLKEVQEEEAARLKAIEEEEQAMLEAAQKEHSARVKFAQDEYSQSQALQTDAERRLEQANNAVSQAWGWYRNKDSMQSAIDEYKAQAAAEAQWAKDFDKLKSRRSDWRTVQFGELSADDEAVRQVALAKEEQAAAQQALNDIAENTAYLKDIADALEAEEEA